MWYRVKLGSVRESIASRPMNVCVVRTPTVTTVDAVGQDAVPPIGPAYITGAAVSSGHNVSAVDAVGEAIDQFTRLAGFDKVVIHGLTFDEIVHRIPKNTEVIGISSMFSAEWPITKEIIEVIRASFPDALIIAGGEHITAAAEFSMMSCKAIDVAVLGEGEDTFVELLDAHGTGRDLTTVDGLMFRHANRFVRTSPRRRIRQVDDIPLPSWSLWPVEKYIDRGLTHGINLGRCMPLLASRGCPYDCTFCSSPQMWTKIWRVRTPELVIDEMKLYIQKYNVTNFDFYDLTAIVKRDWIVKFCDLLLKEGLDITWQLPSGTRSEAIDREVVQKLYKSGCRSMNYAPETGSPIELKRIQKMCKLDRMMESMQGAIEAGIQVKCNIVFGFPGETWSDIRATFKFLVRLANIGVHDVACFPFVPYPGSKLFDQLVKEGKIRLDDEYFIGLLGYTDIQNSVSYTDIFTSGQLSLMNFAGMSWFYGLAFLRRPSRGLAFLSGIIKKDNSSKLGMALSNRRLKREAMKLVKDSSHKKYFTTP